MSGPGMSGPEHYREAERLIEQTHQVQADNGPDRWSEALLTEAQVHATLAIAAATNYPAREWLGATL